MIGLSEASGILMVCTLKGPPVFVWIDSWRSPGFRTVGLSKTLRYSYCWTLRGLPGFRMVELFEAPPVFV